MRFSLFDFGLMCIQKTEKCQDKPCISNTNTLTISMPVKSKNLCELSLSVIPLQQSMTNNVELTVN